MICQFRYVDQTQDNCATLHLFNSKDGAPAAMVRGPFKDVAGQSRVYESTDGLSPGRAFATAIRMANRHDVELVVTGARSVWDHAWGVLSAEQFSLVQDVA